VRSIYNILFTLAFWAASPWLLVRLRRRGRWREGFGQRFGKYAPGLIPPKPPGRRRLWLHAVSVGEVNTCLQFLAELRQQLPEVDLFVSATTTTGMAELRGKLPADVTPIYFPIDRRKFVCRALDTVRPDAVILVEREIWPTFLWALEKRSIPLYLINARISDSSFRAYQRYAFLFRPLYERFRLVAAQSETDAARLSVVGCRQEALHVLGSMKFDAATVIPQTAFNASDLLARAGKVAGAPVIVGGSTHAGEECLLGRVAGRLRVDFPSLFLVLVPRHFERCGEISAQLKAEGVPHVLRSSLVNVAVPCPGANHCLLVDSTGELTAFYAEADVVFVGKSICARGGQNPIEPAALGKAMVFGQNMQNFPGVTQQLVSGNAALQVSDETQLELAFARLLRSLEVRAAMGRNAVNIVHQNQGATRRTVELVTAELQSFWSGSKNA
jgi:3-deoxy-D-manno-octulosonic-acid transferase